MIHKFKCQFFEVEVDDVESTVKNTWISNSKRSNGRFYAGRYFYFDSEYHPEINSSDTFYFNGRRQHRDGEVIYTNKTKVKQLIYDLAGCCTEYPVKKSHLPGWW